MTSAPRRDGRSGRRRRRGGRGRRGRRARHAPVDVCPPSRAVAPHRSASAPSFRSPPSCALEELLAAPCPAGPGRPHHAQRRRGRGAGGLSDGRRHARRGDATVGRRLRLLGPVDRGRRGALRRGHRGGSCGPGFAAYALEALASAGSSSDSRQRARATCGGGYAGRRRAWSPRGDDPGDAVARRSRAGGMTAAGIEALQRGRCRAKRSSPPSTAAVSRGSEEPR